MICKIAQHLVYLYESTDIQDVPQLAIFIHYVHPKVDVKEEMLDLVAFIKTSRGIDVKKTFDEVMNKFELPRNKLVRVATVGATAMMGSTLGLTGF